MLATTQNQLQDTNNDLVYDAAGNLTQRAQVAALMSTTRKITSRQPLA
jgi:hypothetical protein